MSDTFTLTIRLGNAAMSQPEDVAAALHEAADKVGAGHTFGTIMDINGNAVGKFEGAPEYTEDYE